MVFLYCKVRMKQHHRFIKKKDTKQNIKNIYEKILKKI